MIERVKKEVTNRMRSLTKLKLYDKNLAGTANCRVIPVAGYLMCGDWVRKSWLNLIWLWRENLEGEKYVGGKQMMKGLHMVRGKGGSGFKGIWDLYTEINVRTACNMSLSRCRWIKVAWGLEHRYVYCSIKREVEETLEVTKLMSGSQRLTWMAKTPGGSRKSSLNSRRK